MTAATEPMAADDESRVSLQQLSHAARIALLRELSGAIAHELNQPLTSILSNAQAAQRFIASSETDLHELREILGDIVADTRRAGEVIRRLGVHLDRGDTILQRLDVNALVESAVVLARGELKSRQVEVITRLGERPQEVLGCREQLQQVLLTLLLNAGQAMSNVPRQIEITTINGAVEEAIRVNVQGLGDGHNAAHSSHATSPYCLSLALCRTIIAAHGGRLSVSSDAHSGAIAFDVTLPVYKEEKA